MNKNQPKYFSSFRIDNIHFTVITSRTGIREIIFNLKENDAKLSNTIQLQVEDPSMRNIYTQLKEYFNRKRKQFELPLEIVGSEFQKRVWDELLKIPYGKTISYKDLASRLGNIKVIRAAAHANGVNPLPIVIPCHRVVGSNGSLIGYGGGLEIKKKLLILEGSRQPELFSNNG